MSFNNAFKTIIYAQGKEMTLLRRGETSIQINMASSNYSRLASLPEDMVVEGREFVVAKQDLDDQSFGIPERGDIIIEEPGLQHSITEVISMYIFGKIEG